MKNGEIYTIAKQPEMLDECVRCLSLPVAESDKISFNVEAKTQCTHLDVTIAVGGKELRHYNYVPVNFITEFTLCKKCQDSVKRVATLRKTIKLLGIIIPSLVAIGVLASPLLGKGGEFFPVCTCITMPILLIVAQFYQSFKISPNLGIIKTRPATNDDGVVIYRFGNLQYAQRFENINKEIVINAPTENIFLPKSEISEVGSIQKKIGLPDW